MQTARLLRLAKALAAGLAIVAVSIAPAAAERQIVDLHRLDANFQLFAADSSVPWKPATVRLDTYSSAPVAFKVYAADPADVLTAGANVSPRSVPTAGRHPLASFDFTPPGGYQFQSNVVSLPLGSREGFFVVEARRGNVGEQVWINRSRAGLIAKETPNGLLLYGADLGTGMPLARMRVQLVVNRNFVTTATDGQGIVRWNRSPRPIFALAQWGSSYAFVSPLPQPPLPATIVGVRTDSAVVHAGEVVHVAGFARARTHGVLRPSAGSVTISLRNGPAAIAEHRAALDAAGAFATSFAIPENAAAGEYTVLAQTAGGVGGATVDVESNAGGVSLDVTAACSGLCDPHQDVPLLVHSSRGGTLVRVTVVRSPHIYVADAPETLPWAAAQWFDTTVRTDESGNAKLAIPHPNDALSSTYGVHAEGNGATADTRITVPTAQAAIRLSVDRNEQSLGTPLSFDVYAAQLDGKPLGGATVYVQLAHGISAAQQRLTLDAAGHARGSFSSPELGANFLSTWVDRGGRATDAAEVRVEPQAAAPSTDGTSANVHVEVDRATYRPGEEITISASASGAQGSALITFESALGVEPRVVSAAGGRATARLRAVDAAGELRVGAAFVRDGSLEWNTVPIVLAAAGRPRVDQLMLGGTLFAPGQAAHVTFAGDALHSGTFIVRISTGTPSGSARFASAPALLAIGVATTQNSAPESVTWHPWVNSSGEHAQVLGFVRRSQPPPELIVAQAETQAVAWNVMRSSGSAIAVELPSRSGSYELSVLGIADDGSVSAASSTITVR
ncbi:MAG: hypothetical protein JO146_03145 [Candidatus Eremiobacteraeota bacterium]|nr:hypothetical protein [Candidatus Eremiobacteraeota bacterium]